MNLPIAVAIAFAASRLTVLVKSSNRRTDDGNDDAAGGDARGRQRAAGGNPRRPFQIRDRTAKLFRDFQSPPKPPAASDLFPTNP